MNAPVVSGATADVPFHLYLDPQPIEDLEIEIPFAPTSEFQSISGWFDDEDPDARLEADTHKMIRLTTASILCVCSASAVVFAVVAAAYCVMH